MFRKKKPKEVVIPQVPVQQTPPQVPPVPVQQLAPELELYDPDNEEGETEPQIPSVPQNSVQQPVPQLPFQEPQPPIGDGDSIQMLKEKIAKAEEEIKLMDMQEKLEEKKLELGQTETSNTLENSQKIDASVEEIEGEKLTDEIIRGGFEQLDNRIRNIEASLFKLRGI